MPRFTVEVAAGYGVLAAALCVRADQAQTLAPAIKISIDAPGHLNVPFAIVLLFFGGLIHLTQVRLVLGRMLKHLTIEARTEAPTDPLTGTANRRGLMYYLGYVHTRSVGATIPMC